MIKPPLNPITLTPYSRDTPIHFFLSLKVFKTYKFFVNFFLRSSQSNPMADGQNMRRNNLWLHRLLTSFSEQFNAAFFRVDICISYLFRAEQSPAAIFPHAAFAFTIVVILGLLQLKYQGQDKTPFETHPKTIAVAITSLLVYCFAYGIQLWFSSVRYFRIPGCAINTLHLCMLLAASLSTAATASFLFPDFVRPFLFVSYFGTSAGLILYRVYERFYRERQELIHGWQRRPQFFLTTWLHLVRSFTEHWQTLSPRPNFSLHRNLTSVPSNRV